MYVWMYVCIVCMYVCMVCACIYAYIPEVERPFVRVRQLHVAHLKLNPALHARPHARIHSPQHDPGSAVNGISMHGPGCRRASTTGSASQQSADRCSARARSAWPTASAAPRRQRSGPLRGRPHTHGFDSSAAAAAPLGWRATAVSSRAGRPRRRRPIPAAPLSPDAAAHAWLGAFE